MNQNTETKKNLKILYVGRQNKKTTDMIESLSEYCELTIIRFGPDEIKYIKRSLKNIDYSSYDRVLLHIPFRRIKKKTKLISTIPNLIMFDLDTYRNFLKKDDYSNDYSRFYKKLPHVRMICNGYANTQKYIKENIDAEFVPKASYNKILKNLNKDRDIELGFIGKINDKLYTERKKILQELKQKFDLKLLRTYSETEYLDTLNRINIFISADIGYSEYMAKNFEAMICGCLIVAQKQGNGEEEALGFIDMENIVLYDNLDDAKDKIEYLLKNPLLISKIAKRGEALAKSRFSYKYNAKELFEALAKPLRKQVVKKNFLSNIFSKYTK